MIAGKREIGKSACELCWEFFVPVQSTPEAVRRLGRYDVWDREDPEWEQTILPFQYGVRAIPGIYNPECFMWQNLCWNPAGESVQFEHQLDALNCGRAILSYQAEVNRRACGSGAHEERWFVATGPAMYGGQQAGFYVTALACNTIIFTSQFFDGVFDPEKHDVMCAYAQMSDGRWKVSLYSTKPEIDCGAICKTFGGGGHKGAAGFLCNRLPWKGGS